MNPQLSSFVRQLARRPSLGLVQNFLGNAPWHRLPDEVPWTDRPDALERLDAERRRGTIEPALADKLATWIADGALLLDAAVAQRDIDGMNRALDRLWDARLPRPDLTLYGLRPAPGAPTQNYSHRALLRLPRSERHRLRDASTWRTHGFYRFSLPALRIFYNGELRRAASAILGRRAYPTASINFMYGSAQELHQDMAVFHIYPRNHLLGAWVACEDIDADSGPLLYCPGSHRAPFFAGFRDYPQTNLRTAPPDVVAAYNDYVGELAVRYPARPFLAKKGQVLLWHGMLLHGGAPIRRPERTRRSYVIHYTCRHADRANQVLGPFNWS